MYWHGQSKIAHLNEILIYRYNNQRQNAATPEYNALQPSLTGALRLVNYLHHPSSVHILPNAQAAINSRRTLLFSNECHNSRSRCLVTCHGIDQGTLAGFNRSAFISPLVIVERGRHRSKRSRGDYERYTFLEHRWLNWNCVHAWISGCRSECCRKIYAC